MDSIVKHNLELMQSSNRGGMGYLSARESMGGPAGWWKKLSCQAFNFFHDDDGKILEFTNIGFGVKYPVELRRSTFRMAFDIKKNKEGIVEILYDSRTSEAGKLRLVRSCQEYNKLLDWTEKIDIAINKGFIGQ